MKKGTVINFSAFKFTEFLSENKSLIALIFSLILGIMFSVFSLKKDSVQMEFADFLFSFYKSEHFSLKFGTILFKSCVFGFTYLCLFFVFGTTMLGIIFVPLLCLSYGIYFGSVSSYICNSFSLMGVAYNAIVFIPGSIVLAVALTFAARESIQFSLAVAKTTFSSTQYGNLSLTFRGFCIKYIILIISVFLSALLDAFFSSSLCKIFNF